MGATWNRVVIRNLESLKRLISRAKIGKKISPFELEEISMNIQNALKHRDELDLKIKIAAHDIMNVLATGRGYLELYEKGKILDKSSLADIEYHVTHVCDEIKNDYYPEETKIHEILMDEINHARVRYPTLKINDNLDEVTATVDRYLIKAVLRNLITNSAQNINENSTLLRIVNVHLKDKGDHFEIIHEDTGTGIRNGFDPFAGKTGRPGRGTGTGGKIIKKIVEMHGGSITHENKPNGGSRFIIKIPKYKRRHLK